jgi:DNA-binding transcriptional regulator YiaG
MKDEIVRLARKEVRSETEGLKKAATKYRSDVADLKRRVAMLEKLVTRLGKATSCPREPRTEAEETVRFRFSAKRLVAQRQKLGISAGEMGTLVGVSAQTIYNWEAGKSRPRQQQLAALAAVRGLGKRQVKERLNDPA